MSLPVAHEIRRRDLVQRQPGDAPGLIAVTHTRREQIPPAATLSDLGVSPRIIRLVRVAPLASSVCEFHHRIFGGALPNTTPPARGGHPMLGFARHLTGRISTHIRQDERSDRPVYGLVARMMQYDLNSLDRLARA